MDPKITLELTSDELEALEHCLAYAEEHDDEGVRSSEPDALRRTDAIRTIFLKIERAGGQ